MKFLPLILALLCGCASPHGPTVGGIQNFRWLDRARGICAGAQPDPVSVSWLVNNGVTNTIKLNGGQDAWVGGMHVMGFPITTWQQIFGGKALAAKLDGATAQMAPGTFLHCSYGRNRTGTVEISWRVSKCAWTKADAITEANLYDWQSSFRGLKSYVEKLR